MTEKEKQLGIWLSQIADEINITDTMLKKAIDSYEAVGKWLADGIPFDVKIEPQGSMNLGTVTRPISDRDEYDVDLVCLLKNGSTLPLSVISPVIATSRFTGMPVRVEMTAVHIVTPADGPSFGTAPSGTCTCRSYFL